jgi:hypothetical protein
VCKSEQNASKVDGGRAREFLGNSRGKRARQAHSDTTFGSLERVSSSGRWSVVSGQWSVVSGQWSVVGSRWSVVGGRSEQVPQASGFRLQSQASGHQASRSGHKFTTLLSQNSGSKGLAEMRFGSRKQGENENSRSNLAGGFETDTRCWNFVSKLFRSRIYELFARTILANLPKVVSKVGESSGRWSVVRTRKADRRQAESNQLDSNSALHALPALAPVVRLRLPPTAFERHSIFELRTCPPRPPSGFASAQNPRNSCALPTHFHAHFLRVSRQIVSH